MEYVLQDETKKAEGDKKEDLPDFLKEPSFDKPEDSNGGGFGWKKADEELTRRKGTVDRKRKPDDEELHVLGKID